MSAKLAKGWRKVSLEAPPGTEGLQSFAAAGARPRFLILDDDWQSARKKGELAVPDEIEATAFPVTDPPETGRRTRRGISDDDRSELVER